MADFTSVCGDEDGYVDSVDDKQTIIFSKSATIIQKWWRGKLMQSQKHAHSKERESLQCLLADQKNRMLRMDGTGKAKPSSTHRHSRSQKHLPVCFLFFLKYNFIISKPVES